MTNLLNGTNLLLFSKFGRVLSSCMLRGEGKHCLKSWYEWFGRRKRREFAKKRLGCILAGMAFLWLVLPINGHWNHLGAWATPPAAMDSAGIGKRGQSATTAGPGQRWDWFLNNCVSYRKQDVRLGSGPSWSVPRRRHWARKGRTEPCQYLPFQWDWWGASWERIPPEFGQFSIQHPILRCSFQLCRRQEVSPMFCLSLRASVYCRS